jgi:toxin ParE1/3/4
MTFRVFFIDEAEKDLFEIFQYIKSAGYPINAKNLIKTIRNTCSDLSESPERGRIVPELIRIGISDYRELLVKTYRLIYEIDGNNVYIHCVLDGRRDIQTILEQRTLR